MVLTRQKKIAFAMTMLASACLNNVFVSYYVEMFTKIAHMSTTWFMSTQLIFMIWNCSNDILFGWLSDRSDCCGLLPTSDVVKRRVYAIGSGGPLWVVAFLLVFWWPFEPHTATSMESGMWAMFALLFYDGMLTFVEVNHSALLADMTTSSSERAEANMYSAICAAIGSLSSFFAHMFWTPDDLTSFRYFCMAIGLVAILAFSVTVANLSSGVGADKHSYDDGNSSVAPLYALEEHKLEKKNNTNINEQVESNASSSSKPSLVVGFKTFLTQLSAHQNFKLFCVINLLQVFDCTFEKNFFGSFLRHFAGNELSTHSQSVVVSMSFVLPWGCTVFITPIVQRLGLHETLKNLMKFRIVFSILGVLYGLCGQTHYFFLLINRISSECVCRLIPLVIAQLSDEDIYLNDRHRPSGSLRASVFGAANVVGKVGQSVAPMFGYMLLAHHQSGEQKNDSKSGILIPVLIAAVPLLVVVLQFTIWSEVTLKGTYLEKISAFLKGRSTQLQHTA